MTEKPVSPAPADLLQCPHCGDDPVDHAIEPHEHALSIGDWKMPDHTGSHVIECGCGAGMIDETREAVAARWNKRPTPAPAPADHATVEQWEAALTAVMPSDFKDWHQNSRREWPNIAAHVIGNLRQREDEAWATVERLSANAPAPAVPTLPAHQRTAPARIYLHDGDDEHTELFPAGMDDGVTWSSDNATGLGVPYVRADLIRSSVAEHAEPMFWVRLCSDGLYEGPIHHRRIEDVRKQSGAWSPLYLHVPHAPQQAGHIPTVEDIDAQDWAGMDGATAYQVIERHGEDWSHIGRLMAAWLAANQATGMRALAEAAKRDINSITGATAMLGQPAGPLNGIRATEYHDEGAIAQCGACGRYSLDPKALSMRPPACDCGEHLGWCGSFKRPGPDAKWHGAKPDTQVTGMQGGKP